MKQTYKIKSGCKGLQIANFKITFVSQISINRLLIMYAKNKIRLDTLFHLVLRDDYDDDNDAYHYRDGFLFNFNSIHSTRHGQRTAIAIYPSIDDTNRLHLQLKNMQISS